MSDSASYGKTRTCLYCLWWKNLDKFGENTWHMKTLLSLSVRLLPTGLFQVPCASQHGLSLRAFCMLKYLYIYIPNAIQWWLILVILPHALTCPCLSIIKSYQINHTQSNYPPKTSSQRTLRRRFFLHHSCVQPKCPSRWSCQNHWGPSKLWGVQGERCHWGPWGYPPSPHKMKYWHRPTWHFGRPPGQGSKQISKLEILWNDCDRIFLWSKCVYKDCLSETSWLEGGYLGIIQSAWGEPICQVQLQLQTLTTRHPRVAPACPSWLELCRSTCWMSPPLPFHLLGAQSYLSSLGV